jgi:hypothetical protein
MVVEVSVIDMPIFARLVAFLEAVDAYASEECDLALKDFVEDCRGDLARLCGEEN